MLAIFKPTRSPHHDNGAVHDTDGRFLCHVSPTDGRRIVDALNTVQPTSRELATILAALRMWQRRGIGRECEEQDIATDGGSIKPLHDADIDDLCERLNGVPQADAGTVWVASYDVRNSGQGCEVFATEALAIDAIMAWCDERLEDDSADDGEESADECHDIADDARGATKSAARKHLESEGYLNFSSADCNYSLSEATIQTSIKA